MELPLAAASPRIENAVVTRCQVTEYDCWLLTAVPNLIPPSHHLAHYARIEAIALASDARGKEEGGREHVFANLSCVAVIHLGLTITMHTNLLTPRPCAVSEFKFLPLVVSCRTGVNGRLRIGKATLDGGEGGATREG